MKQLSAKVVRRCTLIFILGLVAGCQDGSTDDDVLDAEDGAILDGQLMADSGVENQSDMERSTVDQGDASAMPGLDGSLDAMAPELDASPRPLDMGTMADVQMMAGDAGDEFAGRPTGQCTENGDCPNGPNGQSCSRGLPGGACLGCGTDEHCPEGAACNLGTCVTECEDESECPPGLACLRSGRCGAMLCIDGECPIQLFGCGETGRCSRLVCEGQMDCPVSTTCRDGRCLEDRAFE